MKLQNLYYSENLILQILWGEKTIEFPTAIVDRDAKGIYVAPYLHNNSPLVLNINTRSGVVCNIFGDNPDNGQRISWRNIELSTTNYKDRTLYYLTTSAYNSEAQLDERRQEDRIPIEKNAKLFDSSAHRTVPIRVHDVSDSGIAFFAPTAYQPEAGILTVSFTDYVNDHEFNINIRCKIVRVKEKVGTIFYGCRIADENLEYLLYGCSLRISKNAASDTEATE